MPPEFPTSDVAYLKRNFFNTAIADIYRALDGKSLVGSCILTFCLIDYLTWIEFGDEKYGFNKWIQKRLVPLNFFYTEKDEELYSVRNGLVHSYGPSHAMISNRFAGYQLLHGDPASHLQKINSDVLRIDLYSLLTETVYAAHQVFEEAITNCPAEQLDRMNRQMKILRTDPPLKYADMHRALSCIDLTQLSLNNVQADYTNYVLFPSPES